MNPARLAILLALLLPLAGARADGLGSYARPARGGRIIAGGGSTVVVDGETEGLRLHRPRGGYGSPGYRRPPSSAARRPAGGQQGLVDRAMGEFGGYELRDGLVLGTGRIARNRYDTERDQRLAESRGRWVSGVVSRVGGAVRRVLAP